MTPAPSPDRRSPGGDGDDLLGCHPLDLKEVRREVLGLKGLAFGFLADDAPQLNLARAVPLAVAVDPKTDKALAGKFNFVVDPDAGVAVDEQSFHDYWVRPIRK